MAKQSAKVIGKAEKKTALKKEVVLTPLIPEPLAKKIFILLAAGLLLLMTTISHQYGISGDENFHRMYGHHIVDFYKTFGKDRTAASEVGADSLMVFYGGLFDGSSAAISDALPSVNEWDIRHFINSVYGWIAILCAALVAVEIGGWQAGIIVLLFMSLSPRFFGESMNNPKDITMATGYMIAYVFIIRFLKQLPKPSLKTTLALGAAIGIAMGIRIGGLLLIPYLFLFYGLGMIAIYGMGTLLDFSRFKEIVWPSFRYVLLASLFGYCLSLIFWPYALVDPISHPLKALTIASKFPAQIRILFDGQQIMSTDVPWFYEPKWILISTPLFGLIGLILSIVLPSVYKKENKALYIGFLYFTILFPLGYIIYKKSVLYDGMRHVYFVYPSIIILAGLSFNYLINRFERDKKYVVVASMIVLMALPARWMFANHPNEYVYFNEIEGGIQKAWGNYELDYYMNSVKQCADWLKTNETLKRKDGQKTTIYTNAVAPCNFYFMQDSATTGVGYVSYRNRCTVDADYLILYNRFVDRDLLLNGCYPPEQTVHTITADGVPLACVVKKEDKGDYLAIEAIKKNEFETARQLLEPYCAKYPKNDVALMNLGLAYLQTAQANPSNIQKGMSVLNSSLALNKENPNAIYYLSVAYDMIGNKSQAQYLRSLIGQ